MFFLKKPSLVVRSKTISLIRKINIGFNRTENCQKLSEERGQEIISTCDNYKVIAGQVKYRN